MYRPQAVLSMPPLDLVFSYLSKPLRSGQSNGKTSRSQHSQNVRPGRSPRLSSGSEVDQHPNSQSVPLLTLSRTPSPGPRLRSVHQSEDEDEGNDGPRTPGPSLTYLSQPNPKISWTGIFTAGGLGRFLFETGPGYKLYTGLVVFWVMGCQFGLLLLNRFLLWTGTYKFPYPLTLTLIQLLVTHVMLLGFSSFTRLAQPLLYWIGFECAVAPSQPYSHAKGQRRLGPSPLRTTYLGKVFGFRGLAGGGLFEFEWQAVRRVLPLAVLYFAKIVLSNISYAYAVLPVYQSARIGIVPLSLLFTYVFARTTHSVQTLSSTIIATGNLLVASLQPHSRAPWQGIVAGVFSAIFVALHPIVLRSTYLSLLADLQPLHSVPDDELVLDPDSEAPTSMSQRQQTNSADSPQTYAYYRLFHYTSILTILLVAPVAGLSGEWKPIYRHCYFLDVPWYWFLVWCSSLGCFAVFTSTLLLVNATSPLTTTFVTVPRSIFQLVVLSKFKVPVHSWIGAALCWASCAWYVMTRWREGRRPGGMSV